MSLIRLGAQALALLAVLVFGSVVLWVAVPIGWLWVGSQVQAETDNLGIAMVTMAFGVLVSLVALIPLLGRLTRLYQRARVARGLEDTGTFPLEVTLTLTALVAVVGGAIWFFGFSGSSPIPVGIGF